MARSVSVFVAHVDYRGADLDALGLGAAGREQRERRAELAGEMMDSEIGAVGAELLGRNRELDRLQQRVRRCPRLRLRRRGPMTEGEKADVFHGPMGKQLQLKHIFLRTGTVLESTSCPLLAHSGHGLLHCKCLLSGVKRTWASALHMSAFDPKRTSQFLGGLHGR